MNLPKVSCQCMTYGRPELLNEAVQSFLLQDYPGEKELIIINDHVNSKYYSDIENIKIFNLQERIPTIGEKRNIAVMHSTGDILLPWDDDDISLPHRISLSIKHLENHHYFKSESFWFMSNGTIRNKPEKNVAHAMSAYTRHLFDTIGGYDHIHSGQDTTFENKARKSGLRQKPIELSLSDIYYIYRFGGTGSYHLSSFGYGKGFVESDSFVEKRKIGGEYIIRPTWSKNYVDEISAIISQAD